MRGTFVAFAASLLICAAAAGARADVELKNDGFTGNGQVSAQGGFAPGEMAASRFTAPSAGRTLKSVTFFFGGGAGTRAITLHVYDDTAQTVAAGAELYVGEYDATGSDSALSSIDLTALNLTVPANFRVAIEASTVGAPSIARDLDGIMANRNFLFGDLSGGSNFVWNHSEPLIAGDWIIRATVSDDGNPPVDAGVDAPGGGPDAAGIGPDAGGGGTCAGNGDCAVGNYCDPAVHACTFDCRNDSDCGSDDACNSLGQCVASGGSAGGCCSTGAGGGLAGALGLGAAVALLLARRRRNPTA